MTKIRPGVRNGGKYTPAHAEPMGQQALGHELGAAVPLGDADDDALDTAGVPPTGGEDPGGQEQEGQRGGVFLSLAYFGLFLYCTVYFLRPQDYLPELIFIPLAKITGAIAGLSLILATFSGALRIRTEVKWLLALFAWLVICIPFSYWHGGSFHVVVMGFGKVVLVAIAATVAVNTWPRLRRLLALQTLAMLALCIIAFTVERRAGRMAGAGNMFGDPNDFALQLCIVLPFCVALLRSARSWLGKLWWLALMLVFMAAILHTFSRGGLIALLVTLFFIWWRFKLGIAVALPFAVLALVVLLVSIGGSMHAYMDRMSTIADIQADKAGSAQQRKALLIESLKQTALHPLFGVGPGQFEEVGGFWHVTHNTYTQLSAEAGLPALFFFLMFLRTGFRRLRSLTHESSSSEDPLASALRASLAGYAVGAFFLSTAYWLTPYLLVAYTSAFLRPDAQLKDLQPQSE